MDRGDNTTNNTNDLYRECLRNHAASLGSYATDGCGEFTLAATDSLHCAACGCHRNFHRKVSDYRSCDGSPEAGGTTELMMECGGSGRIRPEMVLESASGGKKRFRTKFTTEQKEKMTSFAEKLGWKLTRKDMEEEVERFCKGVGISRQVFKVWMHNHKSNSSHSTGNASSLTSDQ